MKRIVVTLFVILFVLCGFAQDDKINKKPIFVAPPHVVNEAGDKFDTLTFADMRKTVIKKVNKSNKVYTVEDRNQTKYWMLVQITDVSRESEATPYLTDYMEHFKLRVIIMDTSTQKIIGVSNEVDKFGISQEGFEDAHKNACATHPAMAYIVEAIESAFKLYGQITEISPSSNGKKTFVYVDRGREDGISDDQWFDVYLPAEDGSLGQQVGTLEMVKMESNSSQCLPHKGRKEIENYYKKGQKMIVVSRERSDIIKKARGVIDGFKYVVRHLEKKRKRK